MEIHIKYTNLAPTTELKSFLIKKLGFLNKLAVPIGPNEPGFGQAVHAWVEVGRTTRHHKEGLVWYAECDIKMPGKRHLRATSTNYDLEAAIDEVKDDIELVVRKAKDKYQGKIRRRVRLK